MAFTKITAAGIGSTETVTLDGLSVINNGSFGGNLTVSGVLTYEDVTNVDSVGLITARNGVVVGSGITLSPDGDIFATGITTSNEGVFIPDDQKLELGNTSGSGDLQIFHDQAGNRGDAGINKIESVGKHLEIQCNNNVSVTVPSTSNSGADTPTKMAHFQPSNSVELYFNGSKKFETSNTGATVTGTVSATSFSGDGSSLTGLAAGGAFVKGVIGVTSTTPVGIETSTVTRQDLIGPGGNTSTGAGSSFHGAYMGDGFLSFNTEFSSSSGYYISTFTNALVAGPMQLGTTLTIDGNFTIV